ncbi:MAG: hypothetical protein WDN23_21430 [Edaphobacter sp.]
MTGRRLYFTANSMLVGAKVDATGQAGLTGDYPLQAKVTVAGFDIGKPLAMFGSQSMKAQSLIDGCRDGERTTEDAEGAEWGGGVQPGGCEAAGD